MESNQFHYLIVLDWGTSSFRAYFLESRGGVIDSIQTELGILKVPENHFDEIFEEQLSG